MFNSATGRNRQLILFLLTFTLGLIACQQTPEVVKIGLVAPFEGENRQIGYDAIYSARLAIREINEAGGIGRYRFALTALDDSGDPELAAEVAASLVLDSDVLAVVGHWLPETTTAARKIYIDGGLPLIMGGEAPFIETPPGKLPNNFLTDYASITPFEETAGPYAGPTYDAFYLIFMAIEENVRKGLPVERHSVESTLKNLFFEGITGDVYRP